MILPDNFASAFEVCSNPGPSHGFDGSLDVSFRDVAHVIAMSEIPGEYAEMDVLYLASLRDGRVIVVRANCDTTGWDCQAGGRIEVASDLASAIRWSLTNEDRDRLDLKL